MAITHSLSATTPDNPAYEIRPSHWNEAHVQLLTISGNTLGQSTFSGTNLVLSGGPNATLSLNGNTLVFSGGAGAAGNTGYLSDDAGVTASLGTVRFSNSNGIGWGINGQTLTASHNGLTSQSNQNVTAGNGGFAFQTLSFSNVNGFSFGTSAGSAITGSYTVPTVPAQLSVGDSNLGNTAGDTGVFTGRVVFVGSNNITLSGSSNGGSATISLIGAAGGAFSAGVSTAGNTAGDTGVTGTRLVLAGGNNVTVSQATDANGATITIFGANAGGAQTGISGIIVSDATYTSGTVSFSNQNGVTIGSSVDGATQYIRLSVANALTSQSNQNVTAGNGGFAFQTLSFSNVNGISFGTSAGSAITASHNALTSQSNQAASASNGSFTFQTLAFSDANNVTFGTSAGSIITASVAAPGAAAENNWFNLLGANTAGNTTASGSTVGLSGLNMTLSGTNNSQIVLSVPATSSLVGTSGISISTNGSTISIYQPVRSGFMPYPDFEKVTGQAGQGTLQFDPQYFPNVQYDRIVLPIFNTNSSNSSGSHTLSFWVGVYTRNASSLSLVQSTSSSTALTHSGTAGSYSLYSGFRLFTIPVTTTLTAGQYWIGVASRTTSGGANGSYSQLVVSNQASNFLGHFGSSHNTTYQQTLGQGVYTATTSGIPGSVGFTQIRGSDSMARRAPVVMFASGTV